MNRTLKNIILFSICLVCYSLSFFVFEYADRNLEYKEGQNEYVIIDGQQYEKEGDVSRSFTMNYYFIFMGKCLICDIFLIYLLLSEANRKTYQEVFEYKKKYVVFIVSYISFVIIDFTSTLLFGYIWINYDNDISRINHSYIKEESQLIYTSPVTIIEAYDEQRQTYYSDLKNENGMLFEGSFDANLLAFSINKNGDGDEHSIGRNAGIAVRRGVMGDLTNVIINTTGSYSPCLFIEDSNIDIRRSTFTSNGNNSPIIYTYGTYDSINTTLKANNSYLFRLVNDGYIDVSTSELVSNNTLDDKNIYITGTKVDKTATLNLYHVTLSMLGGDILTVENNGFNVSISESGLIGVNSINNLINADDSKGVISLTNQTVEGGIKLTNNSELTLNMIGGSVLKTSLDKDDASILNIHMSAGSKLELTSDLYVNELEDEIPMQANIITNGYSIYLKGNKIL